MKALFVATVQSHIAQFHMGAAALLKKSGYDVDVAAKDNLGEKNGLALQNVDEVFNVPFERSPFSLRNIRAYKELKKIINEGNYDLIHCNTPVGGILTRLAARKVRKKGCCVIYTAHGFHFYKGAPKKNWILFYPIEKEMARLTDKLITINEEDYNLASQKFACATYHVHGVGIKTQKYDAITNKRALEFRASKGWDKDFLILCTGELNTNKNQKTIIKAMERVASEVPNARLLLAGNGPDEQKLLDLIREYCLEDNITLLGYRTDLELYVHACDVVVSASFREGLPLNIVEAMYCKKPVIASINRGHNELIKDKENGFLVPANDYESFADYIIRLARNLDERINFGKAGFLRSLKYTDKSVVEELRVIYELGERK